jgi:hypothetical protein
MLYEFRMILAQMVRAVVAWWKEATMAGRIQPIAWQDSASALYARYCAERDIRRRRRARVAVQDRVRDATAQLICADGFLRMRHRRKNPKTLSK